MAFHQRQACISEKLKNYTREVYGLSGSGIAYQLGFGFLLLILFPVLLLEILLVLVFGNDISVFGQTTPVQAPRIIEEEIPKPLRGLIPLAIKYGIGDNVDRDDIMKAASINDLTDLEEKVIPRQQEIADWLNTFPENEISESASFFLYLGSACDEVPFYLSNRES